MVGPLERVYGKYRITLRKVDHVTSGRPTPHVEIWKGKSKIGNFDMASGRALFKSEAQTPQKIQQAIESYLNDPQVQIKVKEMIEASYFDLSKPIGVYGGIPRGFRVH
jgi:hypothetical protein